MDFVRNIFLLLVYIAAANCLPNLFDDWDDSILNTDNIAFVDQGISDIGLSGPQDSTIWDFSDHGSLSFSNHELGPWPVEPTDEEATSSIFQDVTGDQWGTFIATSDGDTTQWNPEVDGTTELLAIDDICPLGYWNRCCHNGVCFWSPTPVLRAVCSDEQIWCCYDRPFLDGCHYWTPSGVDESEVFVDVFTIGRNRDELCCRPVEGVSFIQR